MPLITQEASRLWPPIGSTSQQNNARTEEMNHSGLMFEQQICWSGRKIGKKNPTRVAWRWLVMVIPRRWQRRQNADAVGGTNMVDQETRADVWVPQTTTKREGPPSDRRAK